MKLYIHVSETSPTDKIGELEVFEGHIKAASCCSLGGRKVPPFASVLFGSSYSIVQYRTA